MPVLSDHLKAILYPENLLENSIGNVEKDKCPTVQAFSYKGLTRAPVLPAPSLVSYCYHAMFSGCSNLAYIKCLATKINAISCTTNWVNGVSTTGGTFVKASGMTDWTTGNNGIPSTSPPWTVTSE